MKKRNKKYKPRQILVPTIIGTQNIFAAPMQLLTDIRHSYVTTVDGNVMLISTDGGEIYDAVETLELFSGVLSEFAAMAGGTLDTSPVNRLAARLRADMPIDDAALAPVERIFEIGQRLANRLTPLQCLEILRGSSSVTK